MSMSMSESGEHAQGRSLEEQREQGSDKHKLLSLELLKPLLLPPLPPLPLLSISKSKSSS